MLALGQDGNLERRQCAVIGPCRLDLGLFPDMIGGVLKRLKPSDENIGKQQKTFGTLVVFTQPPENPCSNELAKGSARPIHIMPCARVRLFQEELSSVD